MQFFMLNALMQVSASIFTICLNYYGACRLQASIGIPPPSQRFVNFSNILMEPETCTSEFSES